MREILLYDNTDIGRLKSVIDCRQQGFFGVTNVVNYIGNHDHDRMLVELGKFTAGENLRWSSSSLACSRKRKIDLW